MFHLFFSLDHLSVFQSFPFVPLPLPLNLTDTLFRWTVLN
jgi:hypothetical protein